EAPDRWDRADETLALLARGLAVAPAEGRINLALRVANFERSVGRTAQARERLEALADLKLGAEQSRRVRELLDRIAEEERARSLEDWPEAPASAEQQARLAAAGEQLERGAAADALSTAEALCAEAPAWRAARWLRARALEAVGRIDEQARELRILTQLAPSHAQAWRRLGEILAEQGGLLEADRADAALRQALALEPSWTELWLLRARVALRQGRAPDALRALARFENAGGVSPEATRLATLARSASGVSGHVPAQATLAVPREPTQQAQAIFQQANTVSTGALELLKQALDDSPSFIEAA